MIGLTVTLSNAVARNCYLTIWITPFKVDVGRFQMDWQLICTLNELILLKAWILQLSIAKLPFNEQRYHLQLYWAYSISSLLLIPENASIIVCIVESWISFVVIPTILDFFHFTTKVASSVSPSQHVVHVDFDMPLSYSLMTYNTCGLLHFEV